MLISQMWDRVLVETGQFMMGEDIEVNIDNFRILVESTLSTYNQYSPFHMKFNLNVTSLTNSFGGLTYKFTSDNNPITVDPLELLDEDPEELLTNIDVPNEVPDWISDIVPVRLAGVHPWYFRQKEEWTNKELEYKKQFPWEYIKPNLYVPVQSIYEITAVYKHKIKKVTIKDPSNGALREELLVKTITTNDDDFFMLLGGRFLKTLGRNRRAFTLNELPITMDSTDLVSDGKELEEQAMDRLQNKSHKFWLAYR